MAKTQILRLVACFAIFLSFAGAAAAQTFDTKAKQAFMIDADTGTVLFIRDADKLIPPASLGKLMTMEIVFSMLKSGQLKMDDTFAVSENAWRKGGATSGGSTMFAELKSSIRIEDLIQGVIVQSANDGCIILAEGIAGTEESFAELMTKRARELGMSRSVFKNSTGLPADGQVVTVRELAMLAQHIWRSYPEYYKFYSQLQFTWNNITQSNRNPLLAMGIGADGMKTGYTAETGYAIVGSVSRDGRRVFAAMSGMATERERAEEGRKLLEWGIRGFDTNALFSADEQVGEAKVYGGEKGSVALKAKGPISILVPTSNRDRLIARIVYQGPLVAPVDAGMPVGLLKVWVGDILTQETPLFAAEDVAVGTLYQRALDAIGELMIGWLR